MKQRCLERQTLVTAVMTAIELTQTKRRDRIAARRANTEFDSQTVALFDARVAERNATLALHHHQQLCGCGDSKIYSGINFTGLSPINDYLF